MIMQEQLSNIVLDFEQAMVLFNNISNEVQASNADLSEKISKHISDLRLIISAIESAIEHDKLRKIAARIDATENALEPVKIDTEDQTSRRKKLKEANLVLRQLEVLDTFPVEKLVKALEERVADDEEYKKLVSDTDQGNVALILTELGELFNVAPEQRVSWIQEIIKTTKLLVHKVEYPSVSSVKYRVNVIELIDNQKFLEEEVHRLVGILQNSSPQEFDNFLSVLESSSSYSLALFLLRNNLISRNDDRFNDFLIEMSILMNKNSKSIIFNMVRSFLLHRCIELLKSSRPVVETGTEEVEEPISKKLELSPQVQKSISELQDEVNDFLVEVLSKIESSDDEFFTLVKESYGYFIYTSYLDKFESYFKRSVDQDLLNKFLKIVDRWKKIASIKNQKNERRLDYILLNAALEKIANYIKVEAFNKSVDLIQD